MDSYNILPLLGLALRGGRLVAGEEPVEGAARAKDARVLLLAADAADNTRRRCEHFAQAGSCLWLRLPFTKAEFGKAVGRTSVAIAAVTDIGLANAVVRRLAELDPVQYGEAAARLEVKAKRAAERKAEQLAHEKNLRRGKRKPKAVPEAAFLRAGRAPGHPPAGDAPPRRSCVSGRTASGDTGPRPKSRPPKDRRPKPKGKANPYAHSRPVKKGKGSFRKREG